MRYWFSRGAVICLVLIVLFPGTTFAQVERSLRIQGFIGISRPSDKNFESSFWSSFGFLIPIHQNLSLSLDFGHWNSVVSGRSDALLDGTLYVNPFFVTAQYLFLPEGPFTPYVFLGGGYVFSSFKLGHLITIPEITITQKVESGMGAKAGLGGELDLTRNISIVGEVSYFYRMAQARTTIQDMNFGTSVEDFDVDLSSFIFYIGFRYTIQ
jgi:hypothetical protein